MQSAGFSAVCHVSVEVGVGELTTSGVVREKPPDDVALRRSARLSAVPVNDVALSVDSVTSSVARHLIAHVDCHLSYTDDCFSVLSRARSFSHLKVLEAVYISSLRPVLCVQKEYVTPLRLFVKSRIDVK